MNAQDPMTTRNLSGFSSEDMTLVNHLQLRLEDNL